MEITKSAKTALLLGATGLVGGYCLQHLLDHHAYSRVRVLGRRSLGVQHPKLEEHLVNFDELDQYAQLFGVHDVYCCLGTTRGKAGKAGFYRVDFTYVAESARLAAAGGANQFLLVSSLGADVDSPFYYSQVKGEAEAAVSVLPFWAVHIFRPSVLLGERPESRWGENLASQIIGRVDQFTGGLLSRVRPVEAEIVAKAMVNVAQNLGAGRFVYSSEQLPRLAREVDEAGRSLLDLP